MEKNRVIDASERFEAAAKMEDMKDQMQTELVEASMELAQELAQKGIKDKESLTPAERKFTGAFAKMAILSMVDSFGKS